MDDTECIEEGGGGAIMTFVFAGTRSIRRWFCRGMCRNNLNAARYQNNILQLVAIPHITANLEMVLMQDNTTPHTARTTQQVLKGHNTRVLDWPS